MHDGGMSPVKLKPCPFCGNRDPRLLSEGWESESREVDCGECGDYVWGTTNEEAVGRWNQRVRDE